jgi:RNA polymerase sigma-70 factor (ECF subfamily)
VTLFQRGGDSEVVRHALEHADALYNLARWLARDPLEAEELVQETFARALAAARQFQAGTNLKAWLMRILRNTFLESKRRPQPEALPASDGDDSGAPPPSTRADELQMDQVRALVAEDVAEAVRGLPEAWRTVVLLDLEGLTEKEMAQVLECAEGTVKSRLSRARAELRKRLASYHP